MRDKVKQLLNDSTFGVLSTHSAELEGYPFGTLTPFGLDKNGWPVLLLSRLAQHTKNIQKNPRVSLAVYSQSAESDPQACERVTWVADAIPVDMKSETAAPIEKNYFDRFPQSASYAKSLDFDWYVLKPVRARYIGGFGVMGWVEP